MDQIRVLIVDDDPEICEILVHKLTIGDKQEFAVLTMSDQFDRLSAPGTFLAFDCLVLDLWLTPRGVLDDFPLAHKIFNWARQDNPNMPILIFSAVIGLSAHQDLEDKAEMVLNKPSVDKIGDVIRLVTHQRRSGDKLPERN